MLCSWKEHSTLIEQIKNMKQKDLWTSPRTANQDCPKKLQSDRLI
jgi:hypothetical protein